MSIIMMHFFLILSIPQTSLFVDVESWNLVDFKESRFDCSAFVYILTSANKTPTENRSLQVSNQESCNRFISVVHLLANPAQIKY